MRRVLGSQATPDERLAHGDGDHSPVVVRPLTDQPHKGACFQIGLALRDEVIDLERAGLAMIQVRRVFGMCYLVAVPETLLP